MELCWISEVRAVQTCADLVELAESCKMNQTDYSVFQLHLLRRLDYMIYVKKLFQSIEYTI